MVQENSTHAVGAANDDVMLRLPAVEAMTGQRKSAIYAQVREGKFPQPVKLSRRCVVWSRNAVQGWIQARLSEGRAK